MGNDIKAADVVLLFDSYSNESKNLHTSFKEAGMDYTAVAIDDDGFLPDDVISVFGYFLGDFEKEGNHPGKARYFNQIKVPEYWEISGNNTSGKVHNLNKERARIFYAEPKHKRLVKVVDWYDDRGVVRSSDHYNKYGALYARTIFNIEGKKVNKTYFSATGQEIIMENFVTKDILLNDGNQVRIFHNKKDFAIFFMEKSGLAKKRIFFNTLSTCFFVTQGLPAYRREDVLFWQEPIRGEIPGNMRVILNGTATRATKIMVQRKDSYDKMLELGVSTDIMQKLGYIYPFEKENEGKKEVLICTNSDRIAQCREIVEAMPEVHFHICALTEMSSKLLSMDTYSNVSLFPGVKMHILKELFEKCDYYLDINHESEIVSAIEKAFLHNHLIMGFRETAHNIYYVHEEHLYAKDDYQRLVTDLKAIMADESLRKAHLEKQHAWAMLENVETYSTI